MPFGTAPKKDELEDFLKSYTGRNVQQQLSDKTSDIANLVGVIAKGLEMRGISKEDAHFKAGNYIMVEFMKELDERVKGRSR